MYWHIPINYVKNHSSISSHIWSRVKNSNTYECVKCKSVRIIHGDDSFTNGSNCDDVEKDVVMFKALGHDEKFVR